MTSPNKKRTSSSPSSDGSCKRPREQGLDWCADCWALPSACVGGGAHRLLASDSATKQAFAELAAVAEEMQRLQARLDTAQSRLDAIQEARQAAGVTPVLQATVQEMAECMYVEGGDIRIALAATEGLTADDQAALCAALEGVQVGFKLNRPADRDKERDADLAFFMMEGEDLSDGLIAKFPDRAPGQRLRRGTVLLEPRLRRLVLFFREDPSEEPTALRRAASVEAAKVFGQLVDGFDAIYCGPFPDCECDWGDCLAKGGDGEPGHTTIEDVKFVA